MDGAPPGAWSRPFCLAARRHIRGPYTPWNSSPSTTTRKPVSRHRQVKVHAFASQHPWDPSRGTPARSVRERWRAGNCGRKDAGKPRDASHSSGDR